MNTTHIDEELLAGYCDLSVTAATAAAIEAHLMSCAGCRAALLRQNLYRHHRSTEPNE